MLDYRIYPLDDDGHFSGATDLKCPNDTMALAAAITTIPPGSKAEVWQRARLIGTVTSSTHTPEQPSEAA